MNTLYRSGLMLLVCLLAGNFSFAQMPQDKSKWVFEAKKIKGDQYEIIGHLTLEKGWHVFSMTPGGDGSLIPVEIKFTPNKNVQLKGKITEKGKLVSEKIEGFEGKVNFYYDKVEYKQIATISAPTTISGEYTYYMCNDQMCLPPNTKTFTITVK